MKAILGGEEKKSAEKTSMILKENKVGLTMSTKFAEVSKEHE